VPFRAHVEALIRHLMPPIEHAARTVANTLNQLPRRLEETLQRDAAEAPDSGAARTGRRPPPSAQDVAMAAVRAIDIAVTALELSLETVFAAFSREVMPGPLRDGQRQRPLRRGLELLARARQRAGRLLEVPFGRAARLAGAPAIREWLGRFARDDLPEPVARCFDDAPVSDDRLFAGHRRLLNYVLDADASRSELGRATVLIAGVRGAGKSSLLNLCELELPYATHLRLHASEHGPSATLFAVMGTLLDCPPTETALVQQLEERGPAIFVDDLPNWIMACSDRRGELERVLHLIERTSPRAFWVVSIDRTLLRVFGEMTVFEDVFTHILHLPSLSTEEIERLVESRLDVMGEPFEFRSGPWARSLDKLTTSNAKRRFCRRLWRASRGHPGRAVALCREAFRHRGRGLCLSPEAIASPRTFIHDFTSAQLAALTTLHRYGATSHERLAQELALSLPELHLSVSFLRAAGLVSTLEDGQTIAIAAAAERAVLDVLIRARLAVAD
jgi:hypothetical protein